MLETIREYALQRLGPDEKEDLRRRHAAYFLELFEGPGDTARRHREELGAYISLVRAEQENARLALAWYRNTDDPDRTARLAGALHPLWMASPAEARRVFDEVLLENDVSDDARGRVLWIAWMVAGTQDDYVAMSRFLEEGLPLFARLGDQWSLAQALTTLGAVELREGNTHRAEQLLHESQTIAVELGDPRLLAAASQLRANLLLYQAEYERAKVAFEAALRQFREADDAGGVKFTLTNLGLVDLEQGRLTDAASLLRESLSVRVNLAFSSADAAIDGCAAIATARGDPATAARLLGATEEWRRTVGYKQEPFESAIHDRAATAAQTALGTDLYSELAQQGATLTLDQAAALALDVTN
jgi:tetratricopeptide (TPR) repeat protein